MRGKSSSRLRFPVSTVFSYPHRQTILPVSCEFSQGYFKHIRAHACVSRACYEHFMHPIFLNLTIYVGKLSISTYRSILYLSWLDNISSYG